MPAQGVQEMAARNRRETQAACEQSMPRVTGYTQAHADTQYLQDAYAFM